jgi:hypothetical protein
MTLGLARLRCYGKKLFICTYVPKEFSLCRIAFQIVRDKCLMKIQIGLLLANQINTKYNTAQAGTVLVISKGTVPLSIYLSICLSVNGSTVLLLDLGSFFSFLILYTVGWTLWTGHQPVARPLPAHTTQTQNKRIYRHPSLKWDSNSRTQCSSERRPFMP